MAKRVRRLREAVFAKVRTKNIEKPDPAVIAGQIAQFFGILKGLPAHKVRTAKDNILKRAKKEGTEHELEQDLEHWISNFSPSVFFGETYTKKYSHKDRKEYVELLGNSGLARAAASFPESPDKGTFEYLKFTAQNTSGTMANFALAILANSAYLLNKPGANENSVYVERAKNVLHNEIGPLSEELTDIIDGKVEEPLSRPHAYAMLAASAATATLMAIAQNPFILLTALPGLYALHNLRKEPFSLQGFYNRVVVLLEQKAAGTEL